MPKRKIAPPKTEFKKNIQKVGEKNDKIIKVDNIKLNETTDINLTSDSSEMEIFTDISVDKECKIKMDKAIIFIEGRDIYNVMLNQTNLQFNNNKFYLLQLLKDKNDECYSIWMRWARVGKVGQTKLISFSKDLQGAKQFFCKKFYEKTLNNWQDRFNFKKVDRKYDMVYIDYLKKRNEEESCVLKEKKVKLEILECKLEEKLQDLLRMIFDIKEMNCAVLDLNYDADRLPLGRLTETQIKGGYKALREIEGIINEGIGNDGKLLHACNVYYTRIPHDFGMKVPPLIRSMGEIKKELELLETLGDIKIALGLLELGDVNVHPLDRQYQSLDCHIKVMDCQDETYKLLNDYLLKTHGSTHNEYSLEMLDIFEIKKEKEWSNFKDFGNKMLLWHGSRTSNYGGILSQGLRIAPPEAPVTGHMFGKGIYFADISSKSANYLFPTRTKNIGLLLLCEVSLGNCHQLIKANSGASKLLNSVKGCGMIEPDKSTWVTVSDGVVVPVGVPRDSGLANIHKGYLLNYNEYIVYNKDQVKIRYMIRIRFNFQ